MPRAQVESSVSIPLTTNRSDLYWRKIFDKYDHDKDGKISYNELKHIIDSREYDHDIPDTAVEKIMAISDRDNSGYLDFAEFIEMIHKPEFKALFGHMVARYVHTICPSRTPCDTTDGLYEEEYSCWPPALCMVLVSLVEIILFCYDAARGNTQANGPIAQVLIYSPYKRHEAWRFITYMFVHVGVIHLIVNLIVQLFLGVPLEMVHKWWRVLLVYFAGVAAGSLGTSLTDPKVYLAGASGGVYALIAAHIATIVMNWAQMEFAVIQLLVFLLLTGVDIGTAIYNRYVLMLEENVGYVAHLAGAVAGLLVGIGILRNLQVNSWEKRLWWAAVVLYFALMLAAVLANIFWTSHFPAPR